MRIGRYDTLRLLGEGGMGRVHEAVHIHSGRRVALKLLRPEVTQMPGITKRFLREAQTATALDHPNVVDVLDVGVENQQLFMVLELLDGEALDDRLARCGRLDVMELWQVAEPILDALVVANEMGIVHRDLKPANIFLARGRDGTEVPKLLDFGIAKLLSDTDPSLTTTGHLLGSPLYMPPEQTRGERDLDARSDQYSFAALCYHCLTGQPPFHGDNLPALLLNINQSECRPLDSFGFSKSLADVIERGLSKERDARHPTTAEFKDALAAAIDVPTSSKAQTIGSLPLVSNEPTTAAEGSRLRLLPWMTAAALVLLGGVLAWLITRPDHQPTRPIAHPEPTTVQVPTTLPRGRVPETTPAIEEATPPATREVASMTHTAQSTMRPTPNAVTMTESDPAADPLRVVGMRTGELSQDDFLP